MKKLVLILLALLCMSLVVAQQEEAPAESLASPTPDSLAPDSARQFLKEVSVDLFEREASWFSFISPDDGVISTRLFGGAPLAKEELPPELPEGTVDEKVLGVKTEFFRRGFISMYITPTSALPIEGITKTVSVWVAGRNFDHELVLMLRDVNGKYFELPMGTLNFSGWKKITVAIPPSIDGVRGIVQESKRYPGSAGITIAGFKVECDPLDAYGIYYIYFDDMRAVTDLYQLEARDLDDLPDSW